MGQRELFDGDGNPTARRGLAPRDPHVRTSDAPRIRGQNLAVLLRLRERPATSAELAAISLKYTGRVSDLRKAGAEIIYDGERAVYVLVRDLILDGDTNRG